MPIRGPVRFVPDFPIPMLDFRAPVALDAVVHPLENQLGPFRIILGRVGPTSADLIVVQPGSPLVLIRLGLDRKGLRHEPYLRVGPHASGAIGVKDAVQDGPVIDWSSVVLAISTGAAPFQGGRA